MNRRITDLPPAELTFREVVLKQEHFICNFRVNTRIRELPRFHAHMRGVIEESLHQIEHIVLSQHLESREVVLYWDEPRTWIDHFFKWLKRPYRTRRKAQRVRFEVKALYPEANIAIDKLGKPHVISILNTDDMVYLD